ASGAQLDLKDDAMIAYMNRATIESLVRHGFNGGAWNGVTAIDSSAAAASDGLKSIGIIRGMDTGSDNGGFQDGLDIAIGALTSIVRYTWTGDSNLDGKVTFDDFQ